MASTLFSLCICVSAALVVFADTNVTPAIRVNVTATATPNAFAARSAFSYLRAGFMPRMVVSGIYVMAWKLKIKANNTTLMMEKKYPFINSRQRLIPPIMRLGIVNTANLYCSALSVNEQFKVLYSQILAFIDPIAIACKYHAAPPGTANHDLSLSWSLTRINLHQMYIELHKILLKRNITIPTVKKVTESHMDAKTRAFLNLLQRRGYGVVANNTNVKIYRNYVMVATLRSMVIKLQMCIPT